MRQLAHQTGLSPVTILRHVQRLKQAGWMKLLVRGKQPGGRIKPIPAVPLQVQIMQSEHLKTAHSWAPQKGEFLAKALLEVWIPLRDYVDNARPEFLINPASTEPLEYDRYYPDKVAFEFNGPQHYAPTEKYPDKQAFRDTAARDLMKQALSQKNGVTMVTLTYKDLSLEGVRNAIPPNIAVRDWDEIDVQGPYIRTLERLCKEYRSWAERRALSNAEEQKKNE